MTLAIAAHKKLEVVQLDVQTAFPNASVQEEVYVKTPPGCGSVNAATGLPQVMKLKESLYELRQSPRNWFNAINDSLQNVGVTPTTSDLRHQRDLQHTDSIPGRPATTWRKHAGAPGTQT